MLNPKKIKIDTKTCVLAKIKNVQKIVSGIQMQNIYI